jgi:hypothetical protein
MHGLIYLIGLIVARERTDLGRAPAYTKRPASISMSFLQV